MDSLLSRATWLHDHAPEPEIAARIASSVIRPLTETTDPGTADASPTDWESGLWELTADMSGLAADPGAEPQLIEAAAALQELLARFLPDRLAELQTAGAPTIRAMTDGPYLVSNATRITNWLGEEIPVRPLMALCRCGASASKPLCDGSHATAGFSSAKDPKRVPDRRDTYVGQQVTVLDNRGICQHSGFCTDRLNTVFRAGTEPFVAPSGGRMDEIIRAVRDCPSGALSYAMDGRESREQVDYDNRREPNIEVTKDGPYRITGGITLVDGDGQDMPRNAGASDEHCALCRCGQSQNKPFCSGMHWYVDFHDPAPPIDHEPTIFEWFGGLPALTRMTRLFYEKFVPQDPLLAPLFAEMSADHPERVAKWLGEVFCGPKAYSEAYGGYSRMISQHIGKGLTEEKRARWVALMLQAAHEAGLPNDAESRSALSSYIEWGSRLAVENSQPGARPPENMPMPRWDWHTAAGPPSGRISALATPEEEPEVELPEADVPLTFDEHIKPLFRSRDRQSMSFAFDLWAYDDVKTHAAAILQRLESGSMPCDGAWPAETTAVFQRWVEADTP